MIQENHRVSPDKEDDNKVNSVSIVIPILNEIHNIPNLVNELDSLISRNKTASIVNEIVFVDDCSTDGTVEFLCEFYRKPRSYSVKIIQREKKFGTMSAELLGCKKSTNEIIIKMDGDGQHPVDLIEEMINTWRDDIDCVVASRYVSGGKFLSPQRLLVSRIANFIAYAFVPDSRSLRDPLSGYFIIRKSLVKNLYAYENSYKLLLYVLATNGRLRVIELPYVMTERKKGVSKIATGSWRFLVNYIREVIRYRQLSFQATRRRIVFPT